MTEKRYENRPTKFKKIGGSRLHIYFTNVVDSRESKKGRVYEGSSL